MVQKNVFKYLLLEEADPVTKGFILINQLSKLISTNHRAYSLQVLKNSTTQYLKKCKEEKRL